MLRLHRPRRGRRTVAPGLVLIAALLPLAAPWPVKADGLAEPPAGTEAHADRVADAPTVYPHGSFLAQKMGEGPRSYWLFEPSEPSPPRAPVVVFCHGWLSMNPGLYGAWIEHLTRRGFVVIFPRYQADWTTPPIDFLPNAAAAVRDALDVLETAPGRVRPDRDRIGLIGHSAGGNLAALLAASADRRGLPEAKAVVAIMPGEVLSLPEPCPSQIPDSTLMVVAAGDQDYVVGDSRARALFEGATAVPAGRKAYVFYRTDRRGPVPLVAEHTAPTGRLERLDTGEGPLHDLQFNQASVNLLDRFGFWRLADLTLDAAFAGLTLDDLPGGRSALGNLGRWGDGRPVLPAIVASDLATVPQVALPHGARLIPWQPVDFLRAARQPRDPAAPAAVQADARTP